MMALASASCHLTTLLNLTLTHAHPHYQHQQMILGTMVEHTKKDPHQIKPSTLLLLTFKDIQSLSEEEPKPQPESPKSPSISHRARVPTSLLRTRSHRNAYPLPSKPSITLLDPDQHIILYFTSLCVARKAFKECRVVRSILPRFPSPDRQTRFIHGLSVYGRATGDPKL